MPTISPDEVEAEARAILQDQITRSAWFREGMTEEKRRERINLEVDAWWHLKVEEAAHRLINHTAYRKAAE